MSVCCFPSSAQNPGNVPGYSLWVTGDNNGEDATTIAEDLSVKYFNFNRVIDVSGLDKKKIANVISSQYSLFVVFKSDFDQERMVLTLSKKDKSVLVTNKGVLSDHEMIYRTADPRNGIIISYLTGDTGKGKRNNNFQIDDLFATDTEGLEKLMEVLYYPRLLNNLERQKVETYLSLKYGVSIIGESSYTNSQNDTIWNYKQNSRFNNNVTGVGRDDNLNLYQKQSGNSTKNGLYVGLGKLDSSNTHNKYVLKDKTFLLWGDNSGQKSFSQNKKDKNLKTMECSWKIVPSLKDFNDSLITQIAIRKEEIGYTNYNPENEFMWLAINKEEAGVFDYTASQFIKQSSEDENFIFFDSIFWDVDKSGADVFTFITGPDMFIEYDTLSACSGLDQNSINVAIAGGTPPYSIELTGGVINELVVVDVNQYNFDNLPKNIYNLKVTDINDKAVSQTIEIVASTSIDVTLDPVWHMNTASPVIVTPVLHSFNEKLNYEWCLGDIVLSDEEQFTCEHPGMYTLNIITESGCKKKIDFEVSKKTLNSEWTLYPNPTKHGNTFSVHFNLNCEQNVSIRINSIDGKMISNKNIGKIKTHEYRDTIMSPGLYLITITIGNTSETVKLIIE